MVVGELEDPPVADEVRAGIADMGDVDLVCVEHQGGAGGPHSAQGRLLHGNGVDRPVGEADGFGELQAGLVPDAGRQLIPDGLNHGAARLCAADRPAHAVRHDEERIGLLRVRPRQIRDDVVVFVGRAHAPDVGVSVEAGGHADGMNGWRHQANSPAAMRKRPTDRAVQPSAWRVWAALRAAWVAGVSRVASATAACWRGRVASKTVGRAAV